MQERKPLGDVMFVRRKDLASDSRREFKPGRKDIPVYECQYESVRGSVWEHVSHTAEVFYTISYTRVRKDGSGTRFPYSFYPNDVHAITSVAYDCYNWLSCHYGENPSQE
jgi:hypothetical protein